MSDCSLTYRQAPTARLTREQPEAFNAIRVNVKVITSQGSQGQVNVPVKVSPIDPHLPHSHGLSSFLGPKPSRRSQGESSQVKVLSLRKICYHRFHGFHGWRIHSFLSVKSVKSVVPSLVASRRRWGFCVSARACLFGQFPTQKPSKTPAIADNCDPLPPLARRAFDPSSNPSLARLREVAPERTDWQKIAL